MASTSGYYYPYHPTASLPVNVPSKQGPSPQHPQHYVPGHSRTSSAFSQYSVSPPERPDSASTSSGGLYSSASSQYGGSDYDSTSSGAASLDLLDYMDDRVAQTYNPLPMDRNLARQAQMSGELNAKNREILELQARARARLTKTRANFAEGMKAAREVQRDLDWTQKKVQSLNARAAAKYPEQYRAARERYSASGDY